MNYYAVERSTDHLAHYGVKGMRWGVRRAVARGNDKAIDKHYRKAAKKLAKLQDIGLNSAKYAAKSAAYGAAAAGTGTLAVGGTSMLSKIISKPAASIAANYAQRHGFHISNGSVALPAKYPIGSKYAKYKAIYDAPKNLQAWGNKENSVLKTNNNLYRAGTGIAAVGLAAKFAQNAYRASHGAKYRQKAYEFKNTMDDVFSGTKYAGSYVVPKKKRRKSK